MYITNSSEAATSTKIRHTSHKGQDGVRASVRTSRLHARVVSHNALETAANTLQSTLWVAHSRCSDYQQHNSQSTIVTVAGLMQATAHLLSGVPFTCDCMTTVQEVIVAVGSHKTEQSDANGANYDVLLAQSEAITNASPKASISNLPSSLLYNAHCRELLSISVSCAPTWFGT